MARKKESHKQKNNNAEEAPVLAEPPAAASEKKPWWARVAHHAHKLWWLHSFYALGLGIFVMIFAQKGFQYARWLLLIILAVWLLIVVLFRFVGSGQEQKIDTKKKQAGFLTMTYILKNFYQGMLFFLLPFYWKTMTLDAGNRWFVVGLAMCALLATLDVIFDRVLMKWRLLASIYYAMALFACLNLAVPSVWPLPALWSMMLAAAVGSVAFWSMHMRWYDWLRPSKLGHVLLTMVVMVGLVYVGRRAVPPVPLSITSAALGPETLKDGRLAMHVTTLHTEQIHEMIAVTEVATPAGFEEDFRHVWRFEGAEVFRLQPKLQMIEGNILRLRSDLIGQPLPTNAVGEWSVDVETAHGQLIGRVNFSVVE